MFSAVSTARANAFVQAWRTRAWLTPETYPAAPASVSEMYETHAAVAAHPLIASEFGGVGGYKLGAIGAVGEACIYAPLFKRLLVPAPGDGLSSAAYQLFQIEPEIGITLGSDLPPRADGSQHSVEAAWAAAAEVVLCVECCGRRRTPDVQTSALGSLADTLSSGGVVLGPRLPTAGVAIDALRCATQLRVNGEPVASGSGAAAPLGGPAEALAWLANHLNARGLALEKGMLVATGQTCNTQACKPGDAVEATWDGLGRLEMRLAP